MKSRKLTDMFYADCYSWNISFKSCRLLESRANITSRFTQKIDDSIQNISKPSKYSLYVWKYPQQKPSAPNFYQ